MKTLTLAVMTCVALALPAATRAATFTVNSPSDKIDIQPGDGVCATLEHTCTLRAAILEANALPGPDTIIVPPGSYRLLIDGGDEDAGVTGDLDITDDLAISGGGETTTIIDGYHIDRVFDVHSPAHVTLSDMTITNGQPRGAPDVEYDAGGMLNTGTVTLSNITFFRNRAGFNGGWIGGFENDGTATLADVTFVQNHAADSRGMYDDFGAGSIGAMWNLGTATLTDVKFRGNRAGNAGYDGGGDVGALENDGDATLTHVTFELNRAGISHRDRSGFSAGGGNAGAMVNFGTATLTDVVFDHNRAGNGDSYPPFFEFGGGHGGGMWNEGTAVLTDVMFIANRAGRGTSTIPGGGDGGSGGGVLNRGTMTVTNATFVGNRAGKGSSSGGGDGGGIWDDGNLTLTNVTLTRNRAGNGVGYYFGLAGGSGGGLLTYSPATLINVTFAGNRAGRGARPLGDCGFRGCTNGGGNQIAGTSSVHLTNTIVFGPGDSCCNTKCESLPSSLGHNLDSGATCGFTAAGDLSNSDPQLASKLGDNGGFTPTLALQSGSPAIDAGDDSACPATDQRGVARPQGAACDIGAYEFQP